MNEALVKKRVARATSRLAARFERFLTDNHPLLTRDTEKQLRQVITDLRQTRVVLGVQADGHPDGHMPADVDGLTEALESYANEFADKDTYVENVRNLAVASFDSAHHQ